MEKASWVEVGEMGGFVFGFFYWKSGQLKQRRVEKVGALAWIFADVNNRRFEPLSCVHQTVHTLLNGELAPKVSPQASALSHCGHTNDL